MLRKLILAAAALCALVTLFAAQSAGAQTFVDEPHYVAPLDNRYVAPSDDYVVVERRVYRVRPAAGQPPLVERRVYEPSRPVPPAPIVRDRTYGVQSVIDDGSAGQCRIAVRQWTNEYGELMQGRVRVCD